MLVLWLLTVVELMLRQLPLQLFLQLLVLLFLGLLVLLMYFVSHLAVAVFLAGVLVELLFGHISSAQFECS